jgi:hypothetical protein
LRDALLEARLFLLVGDDVAGTEAPSAAEDVATAVVASESEVSLNSGLDMIDTTSSVMGVCRVSFSTGSRKRTTASGRLGRHSDNGRRN